MNDVVDLRSDTVTRPSAGMRRAMIDAPLGDDVFGDDPTVNRLQEHAAALFGFEAALLFPSGTQSNLAALISHCQRGDEVIIGAEQHSYRYEAGGMAVLGSIHARVLANRADGTLDLAEVEAAISPDDPHFARTRLLALENNVERLTTDHANAERLANGLRALGLACEQHTNMVFVTVPGARTAALAEHLKARNILVLPGMRMRLVAHLDVDTNGIERALGALGEFFRDEAGAPGGIRTHDPWLRRPIL